MAANFVEQEELFEGTEQDVVSDVTTQDAATQIAAQPEVKQEPTEELHLDSLSFPSLHLI